MAIHKPATANLILLIALALAGIAVVQITTTVSTIDPAEASVGALVIFFTSLWMLVVSSATVIQILIAYWGASTFSLRATLRRSVITGCATTALLVLSSYRALTILEIIGIVIGAALIEFYFQADKRQNTAITHEQR